MPQQQYMTSNQYMVPYPQAGTGNVKPVYYPALPWQQQQQQQQPQQHYSNSTSSSPRPAYEQRRPFNNNQQFNTNGYQNHRYGNNYPQQQRGTYRKRGQANSSWSGIGRGRGNGFNNNSSVYHGKRYNNNHHHEDNSPPTTTFEAEPSAVL
jgi:hypothetical protein